MYSFTYTRKLVRACWPIWIDGWRREGFCAWVTPSRGICSIGVSERRDRTLTFFLSVLQRRVSPPMWKTPWRTAGVSRLVGATSRLTPAVRLLAGRAASPHRLQLPFPLLPWIGWLKHVRKQMPGHWTKPYKVVRRTFPLPSRRRTPTACSASFTRLARSGCKPSTAFAKPCISIPSTKRLCCICCCSIRRAATKPRRSSCVGGWIERPAEVRHDIAAYDGAGGLLESHRCQRRPLLFRLGGEWLALPASALHEVISVRPIHRIPFHGGLLAGVVNVRGELHLAIRMDHLLGITHGAEADDGLPSGTGKTIPRLLVAGRDAETWVFRVDHVDRVYRLAMQSLKPAPPTRGRAASRFTRGVFRWKERAVGLLDEERLFEAVRTSVR